MTLSKFQTEVWTAVWIAPWKICWLQLSILSVFGKPFSIKWSSSISNTFQLTEDSSIDSWSKQTSGNSFEVGLIFSRSTFASDVALTFSRSTYTSGHCQNCDSIYWDSTVLLVSFQKGMPTSIWQLCMTEFELSSKEKLEKGEFWIDIKRMLLNEVL